MDGDNNFLRKPNGGNGTATEEPELFTNNLKPDDEFLNHLLFNGKELESWSDLNKCYKEMRGLLIKSKELNKSLTAKQKQLEDYYFPVLGKAQVFAEQLKNKIENFVKSHADEMNDPEVNNAHKIRILENCKIEIEEKIKLIPIK